MRSSWVKNVTAAVLLLIGIAVLRLAVPIQIEGDWTGSLTKCACNHRNLVRFHEGHVTWYGHGGDASELTDWGTYRKVGWNTYQWTSPKHPPTTVCVGWFCSSYQGGFLKQNEALLCWRYPFPWRANKLFRECEQLTVAKKKQFRAEPFSGPSPEPQKETKETKIRD
jgi:hypothetical protein